VESIKAAREMRPVMGICENKKKAKEEAWGLVLVKR
jgi:hypothetical protein